MSSRHRHHMFPVAVVVAGLGLLSLLWGCATPGAPRLSRALPLTAADVVVFAPHPDDESIGCGGVIQQALAAGKRVRVVWFTYGDGYPLAAAALRGKAETQLVAEDFLALARVRQREGLAATRILGLKREDVTFLGYPDAGLDKVYETVGDAPFRSPFTGKSETFGPLRPEYHSMMHGRPAAYTRAAVLSDVAEIVRAAQPSQIYASSGADQHLDHHAAFLFVRDALASVGYGGKRSVFLVHAEPLATYPCPPGPTPHTPIWPCPPFDGRQIVPDAPWPPPERVPVTVAQAERKLAAIRAHRSQWQLEPERTYVETFVKSEEVFWPLSPAP
jgi:LmbE family N-acetylglucosaminyl deacetylase